MSFVLAGNLKVKDTVLNALKENRLPHAIIIEGDVGTGRHTLAKYLAKSIVCENIPSPCDNCKNCLLADDKNHPDIITVKAEEKKKNISVNQVRQLISEAYVKPHTSNKKVFIIDGANTLNEQSQNTLLKILEEPPKTVSFILITESKSSLLETIISRCVVLSLTCPSEESAMEYISKTTKFKDEDIKSALLESRNNIGKALLILNGKSFGTTDFSAEEFIGYMLRNDTLGMLCLCAKFEKSRTEAADFFKSLKIAACQKIQKEFNLKNAKALSNLYSQITSLEINLSLNTNLSLIFTTLVSRLN